VVQLDLINKIEANSLVNQNKNSKNQPVKFKIEVDGRKYYRTMISEYSKSQMEQITDHYTNSTKNVLLKKRFKPIEVSNKTDADIYIKILDTPHMGSVGPEYLTGLSFGVIPSWPELKNQYNFDFESTITGSKHKYWVNATRYNHLLLFPVFWINFFKDNAFDKYEQALDNFIINNKITP
jgi:hypothetical protein